LEAYLRGEAEWLDVLGDAGGPASMKVGAPTLDLLELMNTPVMARLWETVKSRYDLVLVEGPGIMEDEASVFLAGLADRIIYVIGSTVSPKSAVDAAFSKMEEHHVRPSLLVLNLALPEFCGKESVSGSGDA
jgi:Mrp family chromosome partitioning ATPase